MPDVGRSQRVPGHPTAQHPAVSREPRAGDPTHAGPSSARGRGAVRLAVARLRGGSTRFGRRSGRVIGSSFMERWQVDLLLIASIVGLAAALWSRPQPALAPRWTALGAVSVLALSGLAPMWTVAAVIVAAVAGAGDGSSGPRALGVLRVPAVALAAGATWSGPVAATLTVTVVGLVAVVGLAGGVRRLPRHVVGWLVVGSAGALWLCVPDTEQVLVVGAASLGPAALSLSTRSEPDADDRGRDWFPLVLLLCWAQAEGFRGRPGGLPAAWVVLGSLAAWPLADALIARWRPRPPTCRWQQWFPPLVAVAAIAVVAARTIGLSDDLRAGLAQAMSSVLVAGGLWLHLAWRARDPSEPDAPAAQSTG